MVFFMLGRWTSGAASPLVDLLELAFRPLHRVLGLHALDTLGEHVGHDVLGEGLGGLGGGGPGEAEEARVPRRGPEHLEGLVELAPHGLVLPLLGGADGVAFLRPEPLAIVLGLVEPEEEVLGGLLFLPVLHAWGGLVGEGRVGPGGPAGSVAWSMSVHMGSPLSSLI